MGLRRVGAGAFGLLVALSACATQATYTDSTREPVRLGVPVGTHNSVAWLNDDALGIATFEVGATSHVDLVDITDPTSLKRVPTVPAEADCSVRFFYALTRLPNGKLGFADTCEENGLPTRHTTLNEYDSATGSLSSLGDLADAPADMAWTNDMETVYYTAGTPLCNTLYRRTATDDGPLLVDVVVDGNRMTLGENVVQASDRCTQDGESLSPTINPSTQQLATYACPARGVVGQGRIDNPCSIVLVGDQSSGVVLNSIFDPAGLVWLDDERLVFGGRVSGVSGVWLVNRDGSALVLLSRTNVYAEDISPDGKTLVGLIDATDPNSDTGDVQYDVYTLDISDFAAGN